jgi:hypothetical protein
MTFSLRQAKEDDDKTLAEYGGDREKMIDDPIVTSAGLKCGMMPDEARAMKAQINTGIWPTRDPKYDEFLRAIDAEEAYWRPGKVTLPEYDFPDDK